MVATAVIFSSALPAMFGTFVKHRFQNTYDAILAAPVDVEELVTADPRQVLSQQQMLDVANQFYLLRRYPQAAACYERFLQHYPRSGEAEHVRLLLGIIYARDLQHYEAAEKHLRESMNQLTDVRRREQCGHWLDIVLPALGRPRPGPA